MTFRHLAAASAAAVLAFVCVETGRAQQPPAAAVQTTTPAPAMLDIQGGQIRVITVVTGLVHPWSIALLPDGRTMLVTEQPGRLRIIRDGVLDPTPAYTVPAPPPQGRGAQAGPGDQGARGGQAASQTVPPAAQAAQAGRGAQVPAANPPADQAAPGGRAGRGGGGQGGGDRLHFVTLHPKFAQNQLVYFSYPKQGEKGVTLAVARGRFDGSKLVDVKDVFVADAWETGGNLAGRVVFGPDGNLYVTVGDRDRICCNGTDDNSLRMKAQALDNHVGKTLRIKDDGSVPPDNPFVGRAGAKPEIYTYGHRNGYGLAFHPETGELWQAEIGPMGGDEVNILLPGHNYGWPLVSMGRNYTGTLVSDRPWWREGMDNPRMFWVPSISPSSLIFYTGDKFAQWKNNVMVGALNGLSLQRIAFGQPSQAERREPLLRPLNIRIRDVQQSPDGYLYVATELGSGGSAPDGTVLKIEPVAGAPGGRGGGRGRGQNQ
jgi:glucose/arabinose dehydrogenase